MSETVADTLCGAPTEKGPCTMKKGHKAEYHRHQTYDTIVWYIHRTSDSKPLVNGTGRLGLQYGINEAFETSDDITIIVRNMISGSSTNSSSSNNGSDDG